MTPSDAAKARDAAILERAKAKHARAEKAGLSRLFEMTYAHDRRKHRHKCQCCGKILREGERVLMYRFGATKTRAVHLAEAEREIFEGASYSFRDLATCHAYPEE